MKTIGIVGGLSPESTSAYYLRMVHKHVTDSSNHAYPRIVISSVTYQPIREWLAAGDWTSIAAQLQIEFESVAAAGADFAILASNMMHKVLPQISSPIPVLTVYEAVAAACRRDGIHRLGLTGTRTTMSDGFYQADMDRIGISMFSPDEHSQAKIDEMIFGELI